MTDRSIGEADREIVFEVEAGEEGSRLDVVAAARSGLSRSAIASLIDEGAVTVDGRTRSRSFRPSRGQRVRLVPRPPAGPEGPAPELMDVPIRYEDDWLVVVSKPAGLVVHPGPGHAGGTLVNALLARAGRPAGGDAARPGIVHRLDAGTSGLMIVAKHPAAFERLTEMMAERAVTRVYVALAEGVPSAGSGTIDAPVGRSPRNRKKMAVVADGREAVTDFRLIESLGEASLLEVRPRTGRTHQIRVHLAAAGHPVVGDPVYGRNRKLARAIGLDRPFLHAKALQFLHPVTGEQVSIDDPIAEDLERALERLRARRT